jgi:hypothetical protein
MITTGQAFEVGLLCGAVAMGTAFLLVYKIIEKIFGGHK